MEKLQPKLRFPGFAGKWTSKKFKEIYSFRTTNSLSRENLNYEGGIVRNIHYGDIHTKFATLFDISNESVPFINDNVFLAKIPYENYCREGDLVIADASEDYEDVGKSIELVNLNNEKVLAGLHTFLARPDKDEMSLGFGGYLMKSNNIREQIKVVAQGTKVLSISSGRLAEITVNIPRTEEQTKIAAFLSAVDEKLTLLKKKKELLEQYKKGVMQKIFNREIRFKDDNGEDFPEWEEYNANEIFRNHSNKKHDGTLPILSASQERGMVLREENGIKIQATDASVQSYKVVEKGDFVISLRSFQGGIEYSNITGICSPAYTILKPILPIDADFYKFYFKEDNFIEKLSKTVIGIRDGKQITFGNFSELILKYPSVPEQTKISSFLSAIDNRINLVEQQISYTETYKKGLLQQMFI